MWMRDIKITIVPIEGAEQLISVGNKYYFDDIPEIHKVFGILEMQVPNGKIVTVVVLTNLSTGYSYSKDAEVLADLIQNGDVSVHPPKPVKVEYPKDMEDEFKILLDHGINCDHATIAEIQAGLEMFCPHIRPVVEAAKYMWAHYSREE